MKKCAVAGIVSALMALTGGSVSHAEPAYWSGIGTTAHEESVEACAEEDNLHEYGDGDYDQCVDEYMADLEMIERPLDPTDSLPTIQEDEPGWDCHTMGNKQCTTVYNDWDGSEINELPRTS